MPADAFPAEVVLRQIEFAHGYLESLIADFSDDEWFAMPAGAPTHLAWQIGHVAMAEYGLCLFRVRGRQPVDLDLMPSAVRKMYSKGSTPDPSPEKNVSPAALRETMAKILHQIQVELPTFTAEQLAEPAEMPYAVEATKMGGLYLCPLHIMIHAGQIGLLRRLLGKTPVR